MKSISAVILLALPLGAFGILFLFPSPPYFCVVTELDVALQITAPGPGVTWNTTGEHTISWTSVSYGRRSI